MGTDMDMDMRDATTPAPSFAAALADARVLAGLTQRELARRSGVGRRTIAALERGETRTPQDATIDLLATALGLDDAGRDRLLAAAGGPGRRMRTAPEPGRSHAAGWPRTERERPLFGRERDLDALLASLVPGTLVTLAGPGGVGKSRLAMEAAARRSGMGRPVHVVPLGTEDAPGAVLPAIAAALDWPADAASPAALGGLLAPGALLLLDDADRLRAAAPEIAALAAAAPQATVLVTSREPLDAPGETVLPVAPLPVAELRGEDLPAEPELLANPAVALFRSRAGNDAGALEDTARIVAALDGLPLAIVLASAQTPLLDPAAILEMLDAAGARVLAGGRTDRDRQATMSAAIAWSADLQPAPARRLLAILGAFRGGFSLEALQGVLSGLGERRLVSSLPDLIRASLVQQEAPGRLAMLEPIRFFAAERLDRDPDAPAIRLAHARWFARWARRIGRDALGPDLDQALAAEAADRANALAAVRAALDEGDRDAAAAIVAALFRIWEAAAVHRLLAPILDDLAGRAGEIADPALRADIRYHHGYLAYQMGEVAMARARVAELRTGDPQARALGAILASMRHLEDVRPAELLEAQAVLTALRHPLAWMPPILPGCLPGGADDPEAALRLYAESLAALEASGDRFDQPPVMYLIGHRLTLLGRLKEARAVLRRDVALCRRHGFRMALLHALDAFGEACARDADPELARTGAVVLGAVLGTFARIDLPEIAYWREYNAPTLAALAARFGEEEAARLAAEGAAMSPDDAAAFALATDG